MSRREFVFFENVNRNRPESNVQTLTRTQKLHSVKSLGKGYELYTVEETTVTTSQQSVQIGEGK